MPRNETLGNLESDSRMLNAMPRVGVVILASQLAFEHEAWLPDSLAQATFKYRVAGERDDRGVAERSRQFWPDRC